VNIHERLNAIRAVAEYLVEKSEAETDLILRAARSSPGASGVTPTDWNRLTPVHRREAILRVLGRQEDDVLTNLLELSRGESSEIVTASATASEATRAPALVVEDGPIFVVHGHGHTTLYEAVRALERCTGRDVVVLHEQANSGRTILEKFEDHAGGVAYAVVLLTADDEGGAVKDPDRRLRGRQNVIFELGFFFGKLGRGRVAVLVDEDVEKPSDIDGLVYIQLDSRGAWKHSLARELSSAKIEVDYSRIP
jgi:predicted nucleotide-binding protein